MRLDDPRVLKAIQDGVDSIAEEYDGYFGSGMDAKGRDWVKQMVYEMSVSAKDNLQRLMER